MKDFYSLTSSNLHQRIRQNCHRCVDRKSTWESAAKTKKTNFGKRTVKKGIKEVQPYTKIIKQMKKNNE